MKSYDIALKTYTQPDAQVRLGLIKRPAIQKKEMAEIIDGVFDQVNRHGDEALLALTKKFDKVDLTSLEVTEEERKEGLSQLDPSLQKAIDRAYDNITKFHEAQRLEVRKVETSPGVVCWREMRPIDRVGLYIPGGTAPLFSTVLMLGCPAQVAGVMM